MACRIFWIVRHVAFVAEVLFSSRSVPFGAFARSGAQTSAPLAAPRVTHHRPCNPAAAHPLGHRQADVRDV